MDHPLYQLIHSYCLMAHGYRPTMDPREALISRVDHYGFLNMAVGQGALVPQPLAGGLTQFAIHI